MRKQLTKITPTKVRVLTTAALGITASVGLWNVIATKPWAMITGRCWERAASAPSPTPDSFVGGCECWPRARLVATPAPKKPLREGYIRVKCKRCGEDYDRPGRCTFAPSAEEVKHFHLTSEEKARSQKAVLKLLDEALRTKK